VTLQETEALARVECSDAVRHALKALFADPEHKLACDFIVEALCGINRLSACQPADVSTANWWNGRRYVGLQLIDIVRAPIPEQPLAVVRRISTAEQARQRRLTT
jgi:hypothetical protein